METPLINVQNDSTSLTKLVEELQKSKADLEAKRHTESTLARLISLMRWQNNDTLKSWVDRLLDELCHSVNGLQASLYLLETGPDGEKRLILLGAYAFDKNRMQQSIPIGEGVIGQVAKSKRPAYFGSETTFDTLSSTTVVSVRPRALRIQPLMHNDVLAGVLEIASVKDMTLQESELILQISENIAANLLNIKSQEQTRKLYQEMQIKSEALISQEEEMRQNVEELQATQEEMRRVQQVLREEAERNKILVESMRDAVITIEKGLFIECNVAAMRIFGSETKEGILNKGLADFSSPIQHSGRSTTEEIPERIMAALNEQGTSFEWKAKRKNGEEFDCEIYLSPFDYQGSNLLLAVVRDISEQKKNEARLLEQQQQMQIAQSIARMGSWQLDLRTKNTLWSDSMYQIYNVSPDVGPLDFEILAQMTYYEDRDLFRQSYVDLVNYGSRSNVEYRILPRGGDVKWVRTDGFAVRNDKGDIVKVYGLVQDITEQKEREMEVIEKNSELAAREEEMRQNLEQLEVTQTELHAVLKRANSLFDNSGDAIIILHDDIIEDVNPAGIRLFGFQTKDSMTRRGALEFSPERQPDGTLSEDFLTDKFNELQNSSEVIFEWNILKSDYEERSTEIRITNLEVDGCLYKQAILRDVTERKLQEQEINRQKMLLDAVINSNTDNIMLVNRDYKVVLVNDTFVNVYKESNIDLHPGMSIFNLIKPEQYEEYKKRFDRALNGETYVEETYYTFQNFAEYSEVSRFPVRDSEGNIFGMGIVSRDITERKLQEFELKRRSKQMETAQEIAKMASWEYFKNSNKLSVSENLHKLFGLTKDEIISNPEFWRNTVIVDDLVSLEESFEKLKNEGISFDREIRFSLDEGVIHWLRIAAVPEYDERQTQIGYLCFSQDITKIKNIDLELSRQKLTLNQILDALPQAIFWKDKRGAFLGANKLFRRTLGLSDDVVLVGKTDYEMPWAEDADNFTSQDQQVITSRVPLINIIESVRNADGRLQMIRTSKFPLQNDNGKIYGMVGTFEDITEIKQLESEAFKFRSMSEASDDLIIISDLEGNVEYINPAGKVLLGLSGVDIHEYSIFDFIYKPMRATFESRLKISALEEDSYQGFIQIMPINGEEVIEMDADVFIVKDDNQINLCLATIQKVKK